MRLSAAVCLSLALLVPSSYAGDTPGEAEQRDRKQIAGTWKVVGLVIDGKEADPKSFDIVVVNGDDGSWLIRVDGKEISKGASTIDATKQPKTIDFTPSEGGGKGERHLGIYELAENTRKLCFALTGQPRPDKFAAPAGSKRLLVRFERVKP